MKREISALLCVLIGFSVAGCERNSDKSEDAYVASKRQSLVGLQNGLAYVGYKHISNFFDPISTGAGATPATLSEIGPGVPNIDDGWAEIPIPSGFRFDFYGRTVNHIYASTDGLITFEDPATSSSAFNNTSVFYSGVGSGIMAWWDDMDVDSSNDLIYKFCDSPTCIPRKLTIQWNNWHHHGSTNNTRSMQVHLIEHTPGDEMTDAIDIRYQLEDYWTNKSNTFADSATVGLADETSSVASMQMMECDNLCNEGVWPRSVIYRPAAQVYIRKDILDTADSNAEYHEFSGTSSSLTDLDNGYQQVSLPFEFVYFGRAYNSAYISANGFLTFGTAPGMGSQNNASIPSSSAPNNIVAAWWDDMILPSAGDLQWTTKSEFMGGPTTEFIVQWTNLQRKDGSGTTHDMQVRLVIERGIETHHFIEVVYGPISSTTTTDDNASIGLEDEDGSSRSYAAPTGSNCNPSCGETNWPAGHMYRYTRPTYTYLYDNYFSQAGPKTLHCYLCHYQFRADTNPFSIAAPAPANKDVTMNVLYSTGFTNLNHNLDVNDNNISMTYNPSCTSMPTSSTHPNLKPILGTYKLIFGFTSGHPDSDSSFVNPLHSPLHWIRSSGSMPFDCLSETHDRGRDELLTWWSEGALDN